MAAPHRQRGGFQHSLLPPASELEFQRQVEHLADLYGWHHYHTYNSRFSNRGWPDLALCRPPRFILAELKSAKGELSPDQKIWIRQLRQCPGVEVFVWRPENLPEIARILRRKNSNMSKLVAAAWRLVDAFTHEPAPDRDAQDEATAEIVNILHGNAAAPRVLP